MLSYNDNLLLKHLGLQILLFHVHYFSQVKSDLFDESLYPYLNLKLIFVPTTVNLILGLKFTIIFQFIILLDWSLKKIKANKFKYELCNKK